MPLRTPGRDREFAEKRRPSVLYVPHRLAWRVRFDRTVSCLSVENMKHALRMREAFDEALLSLIFRLGNVAQITSSVAG